jgi:hypothetical protein
MDKIIESPTNKTVVSIRNIVVMMCLFGVVKMDDTRTYCTASNSTCWPTSDEVAALSEALDPTINRTAYWVNETDSSTGELNPFVSAVPYGSPSNQPFYGAAVNMNPVYSRSDYSEKACFTSSKGLNDYCYLSTRNNPMNGWTPGFIVWPTTDAHVQAAVQFSLAHNLCIMVAGTGHDFLNRHSCEDGIFIRMTLMKDMSFDLTDSSGFGWADGNVQLGQGNTFSEIHYAAAA